MSTLARARRQIGLLLALTLSAGVVAGTAGTIQNTVTDAGATGVREALESLPSEDLGLRLSIPSVDDVPAVDGAARAARAAALGDLPFTVARTLETRIDVAGLGRIVIASADTGTASGASTSAASEASEASGDVRSGIRLVSGAWPGPDETLVQADAAAQLGLSTGDTVPVRDAVFTVSGTWRADDPQDPRWLGEPLWTTGAGLGVRGPLLIDTAAWPGTGLSPTVQWTLVPVVSRMTGEDLGRIVGAWAALPDELAARELTGTRSGAFLRAARATGERFAALHAAVPLSLTAFAGVGALALWEFAGLFARARAEEDRMLWARGTTRRRIAARAGILAAAVAGIGAAIAAVVTGAIWWALACVVAAAVAFAVRGRLPAGAPTARPAPGWRTTGAVGILLLGAIAAVSTWQLRTQGLLSRSDDVVGVDPVAVLAPGALLLGLVAVGVAGLPAIGRLRPDRGLGAARGVVRRAALVATAVVAVALAVGQIMLAAGFAATWRESFAETQAMHAGTALRLADQAGLADDALDAAARVGAVAPVRHDAATVAGESLEIVAVAPEALRAMGSAGDAEALAADLAGGPPELPAGATTVRATAAGGTPVRMRLSDAFGRPTSLDLRPDAPTPLPPTAHGPWRIAAVDLASEEEIVTLTALSTDAGDIPLDGTWAGVSFPGGPEAPEGLAPPSDAPVVAVFPGDPIARLVPMPETRIVMATAIADVVAASEGDGVTLGYGGDQRAAVSALVPTVPGSDRADAALLDIWSVEAVLLRQREDIAPAREAWVDAAPSAASALRAAVPQARVQTADDDPDQRMLAAGPGALWIAAAGTVLLALAAVAASCAAMARLRREEVAVLRALGVRSRAQVALRHRELALVTGWGTLVGAVAGAVVVLLAAAVLARASVPDPYPAQPTALRLDVGAAAAGILVLLAGIAVVAVLYGRLVARQTREAGS